MGVRLDPSRSAGRRVTNPLLLERVDIDTVVYNTLRPYCPMTVSPQVRTTAPEKYRVKPSSSCCDAGASVDIVVSLHGGTERFLCCGGTEVKHLWLVHGPKTT